MIDLTETLQKRFNENIKRHPSVKWEQIEKILDSNPKTKEKLLKMESTGGEPDIVILDPSSKDLYYIDCSKETPSGRRNLCYDRQALDARKKFKPKNSAMDLAQELGVELLSEEEYKALQKIEEFDTKTSSWLKTPDSVRKLGGAFFGDRRYNHVFTYHNGADSYYASRGFRGKLKI